MIGLAASALIAPHLVAPAKINLLVFSKTAAFRHDSIPEGREMFLRLAGANGWTVTFSEDADVFDSDHLKNFSAVVFLLTTGDVLNNPQQAAMEAFIKSGKGYVGIHAASDTEYDWQWYGNLVGAYFAGHPAIQDANLNIEDQNHPAMKHLPQQWKRKDEWYSFKANPRSRVHVLATVDEASYQGGTMGKDHPITWCHEYGGGRAFYTALGHTKESYSEPAFVTMVTEAVKWVVSKN